jgi:putative flippase GtrA
MEKIKRQLTLANLIQFIKLQIAGNILFWGTYIGYPIFHELLEWAELPALATASILAHGLFFVVDSEWVFNEKGRGGHERKTVNELVRFALFMGLNYFINLGIIASLSMYLHITPYIGQFIAALFFTLWTYIGLKYWVFKRRGNVRRRSAKQKAA